MKFICDINIDKRISRKLAQAGHESVHASDLFPDRTSDLKISEWADAHETIVITRDKDFENSWVISHHPKKVILLSSYESKQENLLKAIVVFLPALEVYTKRFGECFFFKYTPDNVWLFRNPSD